MALGAYQAESTRGSVLNALAHPAVVNPMAGIADAVNAARGIQDLRTSQFNLQQAQLQPAYQAMRQIMATNPNPSWDDVNNALAQSARIGANVDGLVANATETMGRGGKPGDFVRAYSLGGMSPENQTLMGVGQPVAQDTGGNIVYGMRGGPLSAAPGQFNAATSIAKGFTPSEASEFIAVPDVDANGRPTGTTHMVPRGTVFGTGVPGSAGGGAGGGGGGGGGAPDLSSLPKPQFLQAVAQRESGGDPTALNYVARADPTAYARGATASGKYQMTNSTWQQGAAWAGVDTSKYPTAMSAPEPIQDQVASAVYDHRGTTPWQPQQGGPQWVRGPGGQYTLTPGAPGGQGGGGGGGGPPASGPFIGATSAQPVTGGSAVQPAGGVVQPAGGIQYLDPTGRPIAQGGGGGGGGGGDGGGGGYGGAPGVPRAPGGGPILTPPAPWMGPLWEQSAKQYSADVDKEGGLAQRIQPWQSALAILKANPNLSTGPTSQQWNAWGSTLQQYGVALPSMPGDALSAYQELGKNLARGLLNSGAGSPTDMARLEAEASSPNINMVRDAIQQLSARQIGYERFQVARLEYFRAQHPGEDPDQYANQYRSQTSQWFSKLDPVAFGADNMSDQDIANYMKGLSPAAQQNFRSSIREAAKLFPDFAKAGQ
jgi:hypothetical protein